jgi:hypothetical protein
MFGAIFWVYIILLVIFFVLFALFSEDEGQCDTKRGGKKGRCDENWRLGSAAEGAFILMSIPLIAWILFFAILSLAILALGCLGNISTNHLMPYAAAVGMAM